jgi:hypothetical protein
VQLRVIPAKDSVVVLHPDAVVVLHPDGRRTQMNARVLPSKEHSPPHLPNKAVCSNPHRSRWPSLNDDRTTTSASMHQTLTCISTATSRNAAEAFQ